MIKYSPISCRLQLVIPDLDPVSRMVQHLVIPDLIRYPDNNDLQYCPGFRLKTCRNDGRGDLYLRRNDGRGGCWNDVRKDFGSQHPKLK
jgi:hypothetical protein